MKNLPSRKSLALLRERGFITENTEHWNPYARKKKDLFGFIDILGYHPGLDELLAVQTTTRPNLSTRVHKAQKTQVFAPMVLNRRVVAEFHGWYKKGGRWLVEIRRYDMELLD